MRLFDDVASRVDDPYLARAVALAQRARGATAPNPLVGCVVVADGLIVGEGFHPRAGEPHAEVRALEDAGEQAAGSTLYVTLEPCAHTGRTPPCTRAITEAGIARVIIGMRDPSAEAGGGAEVLRVAGVDVVFVPDPEPFASLNEGWLKRLATGVPFVTAKVGTSLDARPGIEAGRRHDMTGASGAAVTRRLRERSDAVMVGAATVLADDPSLTVRDACGTPAERQPVRVILVRGSLPPPASRVFTDGLARTVLLVPDTMPSADMRDVFGHSVAVERYAASDGLAAAFRVLGGMGINEVLVEAGPTLLTSMWTDGPLDALVTVTAGGMAGPDAPDLFGGRPDGDGLMLRHPMRAAESGIVGDVVATTWRPAEPDDETAQEGIRCSPES